MRNDGDEIRPVRRRALGSGQVLLSPFQRRDDPAFKPARYFAQSLYGIAQFVSRQSVDKERADNPFPLWIQQHHFTMTDEYVDEPWRPVRYRHVPCIFESQGTEAWPTISSNTDTAIPPSSPGPGRFLPHR